MELSFDETSRQMPVAKLIRRTAGFDDMVVGHDVAVFTYKEATAKEATALGDRMAVSVRPL